MANGKDYYQILGINKGSSAEEIKQAYKKMAKEHHPDMVDQSNKEAAEKRFKEINEAYQVLGDPQKKKMYDQFGTVDSNAGFNGQNAGGQWGPFSYTYSSGNPGANPFDFSGNGNFDPFDIFEDFFGFRGFGGQGRPRKGKNLSYEMQISFKDALFGFEKDISAESGRVSIKVPAGVKDGTELRFTGKGMPGGQGMPAGDLFLTLRVIYPKEFKVVGELLVVEKTIGFISAALGTELEIPVVDLSQKEGLGTTKIKVPSGTQYGTQLIVRGKGLPKIGKKVQGDIIVHLLVEIPRKLSQKQKDLLEQYQKM